MRHDLLLALPLAVAPSAPRMREAPGTAALVASTGLAQRLLPCRARALAPAVALAAVAAPTHQHLHAAACAGERPCAVLRVALPCSTHAWPAAKASTREGAATWHMDDHLCPVPYCARTRGLHEWGAAARTTCPSSRVAAPVPSKHRFYRVFNRTRARSQALTAATTRHGGWGAAPVQAFVHQASQRQRSTPVDTVARGIRPRAGMAPVAARLQCLHPSPRHWVNSVEQGWVSSDER
jgi:hypothetical protein